MGKLNYNIIAIGAGAAGLVTCLVGATVKAKVAVIEKHKRGGDCLNTGCVPSKALISSAKIAKTMNNASAYGIENVSYKVNFPLVMERIQEIIKRIEPVDSEERYAKFGVDNYQGEARIISPTEVTVNGETLTTRNIVIATGARPLIPPIPGLENIEYLHSDNLWEIREQPKRLLVVGGGPIGCELAQAFSRLGSEVTIMDMLPTIMTKEDPDMIQFVLKAFEEDGVRVLTNVKLTEVNKGDQGYQAFYEKDDQKNIVEFDQILIATGRQARTKGFGLEELGIEINPNGTIKVDEYLRTNIPNIYACGDVAGPYQFTHMAAQQAWYCGINALASPFKKFKVDYSVVPWCTYTDPEVARVGLSEQEAKEQNIPYEVTTYGIDELDRAITEREDKGRVKIITPPGRDKILGAAICGYHAGDLIAEFVFAMKHGLGLNKILSTIKTYPTLAEATKFAAGEWKKAHVPEMAFKLAEKYNEFRR